MAQHEEMTRGASVLGVVANGAVAVVDVQWHGSVVELTYKDAAGHVDQILLFRDDEARLTIQDVNRPWSFDGDGGLLRLASDAYRISLAHLFDRHLAVHTSVVDPLPH